MYKILIIHIILTIVFGITYFLNVKNKKKIFLVLIPLFMPIAGYVVIVLFCFMGNSNKDYDFSEHDLKKKFIFTEDTSNMSEDITSLEASIYLSSDKEKQKQFLNFLNIEQNSRNSGLLKKAVQDKNTEISHYASVALTDTKSEFNNRIKKSYEEYKNNKCVLSAKKYAEMLQSYINNDLSETFYKNKYNKELISVLKYILNYEKDSETYSILIKMLIKQNQLNQAEKYCKEYIENFPGEDSYLKILEYYYCKMDNKLFYEYFEELRKSPIILSNKGITIIRFWLNKEIEQNEV